MQNYTNLDPSFLSTISIPENSDPATAETVLNVTFKALQDNILWLKANAGEAVEERLGKAEQNILALAIAVAMDTGSEVEGMSDNIAVEVFEDQSGFIIISGLYDGANHRLYA